MSTSGPPRVAVVTGGAAGIGAAIAEELGRQGWFVVTVDPGVALDGSPQDGGAEGTTARRIVDAGGRARASSVSVTDEAAVQGLFAELVAEFGALHAVVNVAGIIRLTGFAAGLEDDWRAVLEVHLDGYLNVLRAALPIMAAAGHGRILGVTSGSGWRPADAGAYSCAKRAVAALTWQVGRVTPAGVTVNALAPIAATRMVAASRARRARAEDEAAHTTAAGGLALGSDVPPPEHLGPVGGYLISDAFSWCRGQVIFSNGSEISLVSPPRLLEAVSTTERASLAHRLEALGAAVLGPAEATQTTNGGGTPRATAVSEAPTAAPGRRVVIVTDTEEWGRAFADSLTRRGVECVGIGAWGGTGPGREKPASDFASAAEQLARVSRDVGPVDAVVVALVGEGASSDAGMTDVPSWRRVVDEHSGITDRIRTDAAWMRAVSDCAASVGRAMRVVTVVDGTSAGGWSRGQASAQLTRAAHLATSGQVDAFSISVEDTQESTLDAVAEVAAYLAFGEGAGALSGAELAAGTGWFGLRSHPSPTGTVSFDGPVVPEWLDAAVREMVWGNPPRG